MPFCRNGLWRGPVSCSICCSFLLSGWAYLLFAHAVLGKLISMGVMLLYESAEAVRDNGTTDALPLPVEGGDLQEPGEVSRVGLWASRLRRVRPGYEPRSRRQVARLYDRLAWSL